MLLDFKNRGKEFMSEREDALLELSIMLLFRNGPFFSLVEKAMRLYEVFEFGIHGLERLLTSQTHVPISQLCQVRRNVPIIH